MNDLSDEVKAERAKKVESKLMGFHVISLLKMMLNKPENKEDLRNHKNDIMKEHNDDAKEAVAEIIDMVSHTVRTGKLPDKGAASQNDACRPAGHLQRAQ